MELAKKYNKTIAQIILNFGLSRGNSVLTKSVKMERMKESLGSQNFVMEQSDIEKLSSLNRNARKVEPKDDILFGYTPLFD